MTNDEQANSWTHHSLAILPPRVAGTITFDPPPHLPSPDAAVLVTALYQLILERAPEPGGLIYWGSQLINGQNYVLRVVLGIVSSQEHFTRFILNATPNQQVTVLYQHILARAPDPGGLAYWANVVAYQNVATVINGLVY
jgi:uncharacterized protein DUF4214